MDGWNTKPSGWNLFDQDEYSDDIINDELNKYKQEYIFVLAGGLDNLGRNHPWVKDRLDVAYRLYQLKKRKIIILGGGTYHKPPHLNKGRYVIHESTMGAKYLIDRGVDPNDLFREWASYDTIANGVFSLLNFVIPMKITSALIITSDFHMNRSCEIFKWIYNLWTTENNISIKLDFLEVSTKYLDTDIIGSRADREERSLQNLKLTIKQLNTWDKFYKWFYSEHQAYNCRFNEVREHIDEKTKASY